MAILKCKMCGGDLEILQGTTIAHCEFCGTQQTVPSLDNEKKISLFTRANRLRFGCDFDKAASIYESIVTDFPEEAEAYWGLILCKYGIEYVDDPLTGRKIPTCHRSAFESVMDDNNFEMVMECADSVARQLYREEAKAIEELRNGIIEISAKEEPYDIFICYKETAPDGQRTLDSVIASDVYTALTEKGYRVFFARRSLEDKIGQAYEPYIFAALNSAKIMLAFGTSYDNFNAVWVKNEWSRFLHLMAKDKSKYLIPCYKNIDAYDIPKEFQRLQAQDLGKVGAIQDLLYGIEKLLPKAAPVYTAPVYQARKILPFRNMNVIASVLSVASNDETNAWPNNPYSSWVDIDRYSCLFFHVNLNRKVGSRRNVKLEIFIYDDLGNQISDLTTVIACEPSYDKFSKGLILRGDDGSSLRTGKYTAKISVDDSNFFCYYFEIFSSSYNAYAYNQHWR